MSDAVDLKAVLSAVNQSGYLEGLQQGHSIGLTKGLLLLGIGALMLYIVHSQSQRKTSTSQEKV